MDAHTIGGLWLLKEMWGFPSGVPEDGRLEFLKTIMICARGDGELAEGEKAWVIGYGAACGAHQSTVDALAAYKADEEILDVLNRNMPISDTWKRVTLFDAIRAASADGRYHEDEQKIVRRVASHIGVPEEIVIEIEALAREEQELKKKRLALIFPEKIPY